MLATETAPLAVRSAGPFDGDAEIIDKAEMAGKLAREFRKTRKYPIEAVELEAEALLALTQAARDYPAAQTVLPFGAFAAQRIMWRLEDFIQAWYRLARRDFTTGRDEVRRIVGLQATEGAEGRPVGRRAAETDPNARLYVEECRQFVDAVLSPREKQVIAMKYHRNMNLKQIAAELGLTHVRARQIHCEAVAELRFAMGADGDAADAGSEDCE